MAKLISSIEAIKMFDAYKGHGFVHVQTRTNPAWTCLAKGGRETGAMFPDKIGALPEEVVKYSEYNAQLGLDYTSVIEHRLAKQGKDASEYQRGSSWHIPVEGSKNLRKHKDKDDLYFFLFLTANTSPRTRYVNIKTGTEVEHELLREFLPKPSAPKNQGLDEGTEVEVQTLKLESLVSIKLDGEEYIVR